MDNGSKKIEHNTQNSCTYNTVHIVKNVKKAYDSRGGGGGGEWITTAKILVFLSHAPGASDKKNMKEEK
jgi:hypothetical protein